MAESGSRLPQSRDFVGNFAQMRVCFWPSPVAAKIGSGDVKQAWWNSVFRCFKEPLDGGDEFDSFRDGGAGWERIKEDELGSGVGELCLRFEK